MVVLFGIFYKVFNIDFVFCVSIFFDKLFCFLLSYIFFCNVLYLFNIIKFVENGWFSNWVKEIKSGKYWCVVVLDVIRLMISGYLGL